MRRRTVVYVNRPASEGFLGRVLSACAAGAILIGIVLSFINMFNNKPQTDNSVSSSTSVQNGNSWNQSGPTATGSIRSASEMSQIYISNTYGSTYFRNNNYSYPYSQAFDNDRNTCWVEGSSGARLGDYVGCRWQLNGGYINNYAACGFSFYNGMQYKGSESYYRNSRARNIMVNINGYSYTYTVDDTMSRQDFDFRGDLILPSSAST